MPRASAEADAGGGVSWQTGFSERKPEFIKGGAQDETAQRASPRQNVSIYS
jgi:hypothetical protein